MAQKNNPTLAQAKGAPAGSYLLGVLLGKASLGRQHYTVLDSDQTIIHVLNVNAGLVRVTAETKGVFVAFSKNANDADAKATDTLTIAVNPTAGDAIVIGSQTYVFRAAISVKSSTTLTSDTTDVSDGETVTIGSKVYRFKNTMAAINDVKIGADADTTLGNLVAAINGAAGAGTKYYTGTVAHTQVDAAAVTSHATVISAKTAGTAGDAIVTTETTSHLSFTGATLAGGQDDDGHTIVIGGNAAATQARVQKAVNGTGIAGTDYSSALAYNSAAYCHDFAANAATIEARATGTAGNGVATTSTFTSGSNLFSARALAGGVDGNYDDYIPAGATHEYAIDDTVTVMSFFGRGSSTVTVVEH